MKNHYLYGILFLMEMRSPNINIFQINKTILKISRETGGIDESKLKSFHEILLEDLKADKNQREFMVNNFFQMAFIGLITTFVMYFANSFINVGTGTNQIYIHCFVQLFGVGMFIFLFIKVEGDKLKDFIELNQVVQGLSVYCSSGVSVNDAISFSGYNQVVDRSYKGNSLKSIESA